MSISRDEAAESLRNIERATLIATGLWLRKA